MPEPKAVDLFVALEARLLKQAQQIADVLKDKDAGLFGTFLTGLWGQMASQETGYRAHLAAMRASVSQASSLSPLQAAQRRDALRFGPNRAEYWPLIGRLIARQTKAQATLLTVQSDVWPKGDGDGYLNRMMQALHVLANPVAYDQSRVPAQAHTDLGLSGAHFIQSMQVAYRLLLAQGRARPFRFLDVGCGGGTKVMTATAFCEIAEGLEYDQVYANHARTFLDKIGASTCRIIDGDALKFDDYGDYDIIYVFRPLRDPTLQTMLEQRICQQAKLGTVIICPLSQWIHRQQNGPAQGTVGSVFVAGLPHAKLADLMRAAERIGPDQGVQSRTAMVEAGFWHPIIEASRARGFEVG